MDYFEKFSKMGISLHDSTKPVYKYMSIETAKIVLENLRIRFRTPSTFNDPFEFNLDCIDTDISNKAVRSVFLKSNDRSQEFSSSKAKRISKNLDITKLKNVSKKLFNEVRNTALVFCASEIKNDILMWSHYAKSHSGVCLGLIFPAYSKEVDCITMKVNYSNIITPRKFYTENEYERGLSLLYWIYTKADCWKYEKEVRCFIQNHNNRLGIDENSFYDVELSDIQVVELCYGMKAKEKDIKEINSLVRSKGLKLKVGKMNRQKGEFILKESML